MPVKSTSQALPKQLSSMIISGVSNSIHGLFSARSLLARDHPVFLESRMGLSGVGALIAESQSTSILYLMLQPLSVAKDRLALLGPDDVGAFGFRTPCLGFM